MQILRQVKNWGLCVGLSLPFAISSFPHPIAQSVQFPDGTIAFAKAPQLLKATTPHINAGYRSADYYFTFSVPEDAEAPLQQLTFAQREGVEQIAFLLGPTQAYRNQRRSQPINISSVTTDEQKQVSIRFEQPISPGSTVTVGLKARRNPNLGGVYLFGVTAFPAGEKVQSQFLGYGRLHFFRSGGGGRF